jgi:hypothetical protein
LLPIAATTTASACYSNQQSNNSTATHKNKASLTKLQLKLQGFNKKELDWEKQIEHNKGN